MNTHRLLIYSDAHLLNTVYNSMVNLQGGMCDTDI